MKRFAAVLAAMLLVLALAPAPARAATTLVVAHNQTSQENPYQYGMLKFKEALERLSVSQIICLSSHIAIFIIV